MLSQLTIQYVQKPKELAKRLRDSRKKLRGEVNIAHDVEKMKAFAMRSGIKVRHASDTKQTPTP